MKKNYAVLEEGDLHRLREAISTLLRACREVDGLLKRGEIGSLSLSQEGDGATLPERHSRPAKRKGSLASILFELAPSNPFSARQGFEAIVGKYKFNSKKNREADIVRHALSNDDRFEKLPDGKFQRKEFKLKTE